MNDSKISTIQANVLIQKIKKGALEFATKVIKLLYQPQRNVLFSPINIYSALALMHLASDDTTRDELADSLGLSKDKEEVQKTHTKLVQMLKYIENTPDVRIRNAKGIFIQKDLNVIQSYEFQIQSNYEVKISNVDFENDSAQATDSVNQFISHNTEGRIPEMLPSNTRILVAACLHFEAAWRIPFKKARTTKKKFYTVSGTSLSKLLLRPHVSVDMMYRSGHVPYIHLPDLRLEAIDLVYAHGEVSMYYVLPYFDQSLDNVVSSLDAFTIRRIIQQSKSTKVNMAIPRMKCNRSGYIDNLLEKLGIKEIFTESANLANMLEGTVNTRWRLFHGIQIDVSEYGSQVCTANELYLIDGSLQKPIKFYVNRPFLFFVYHRTTQTILFLGTVYNPNVEE